MMKKLLIILGAIGLMTTTTTSVIACGNVINNLPQQISISELHGINNIDEGMTNSEVREEILEQIRSLFNENIRQEITQNDFVINLQGNDTQVVQPRQKIIVEAVTNSLYLKDSFEFNVQGKVDIVIEDKNEKQIAKYDYETDFDTLGEIMEKDYDHYLLRNFGGDLGYYVYGISYYETDGKKYTIQENPEVDYWALYWVDNKGEEQYSEWGISNFYFNEYGSEHIIWRLTNLDF